MEKDVDYLQILIHFMHSLEGQDVHLKPLQTWCSLAVGDPPEQMRERASEFGLLGEMKLGEVLLVI